MPLLDVVKLVLDDMEHESFIRKIETPTQQCSELVVVSQSSGWYRLCVYLMKLNQVI